MTSIPFNQMPQPIPQGLPVSLWQAKGQKELKLGFGVPILGASLRSREITSVNAIRMVFTIPRLLFYAGSMDATEPQSHSLEKTKLGST